MNTAITTTIKRYNQVCEYYEGKKCVFALGEVKMVRPCSVCSGFVVKCKDNLGGHIDTYHCQPCPKLSDWRRENL